MEGFVRILRFCVAGIVLLVFAVWVTLQLPPVQTAIAQRALGAVRDKIDGGISMESLHFKPFNTVVLKGLCITDANPPAVGARDTLAYADAITVRISPIRLIVTRKLAFKNLRLKNATLNIVREPSEWRTNIKRIFRSPVKNTPADMPHKEIIRIDDVFVENFTFRLQNFTKERSDKGDAVNWADLDIRNINLHAEHFNINDGIFHGDVDRFCFREVSGLEVTHVAGRADVGRGHTIIRDCVLNAPGTEIALDLTMDGYKMDFRKFATNVDLDVDIKSSRISLETLHSFVDAVNPDPNVFLKLNGGISGRVCDLHFDDLTARAENYCTGLSVSGDINGLGQPSGLQINTRIQNLHFTPGDLKSYLGKMFPKMKLNLGKADLRQYYSGQISARGNMDKMDVKFLLRQGKEGSCAAADLEISNLKGGRQMEICGNVSSNRLDLKALAGISSVNDLSLDTHLSAKLPKGEQSLEATIDSLKISNLRYKGHDYGNINARAAIIGKDITADIKCRDKALDADITAWSDKYSYNANILISCADLTAMNFSKKEKFRAGMNIYARTDRDIKKINGNASVSRLYLDSSEGSIKNKEITFDIEQIPEGWDISMDSDIIKGRLTGNKKAFTADADIIQANPLLQCIIPGTYIEKNSVLSAEKDSIGFIHCDFKTGRLAYYDKFLKNFELKVDGSRADMDAKISAETLDIGGANYENPVVSAHMKDSLVNFSLDYGSTLGKPVSGHLSGDAVILAKDNIEVRLQPSEFYAPVHFWKGKACTIRLKENKTEIRGLYLDGGPDKWIKANGAMSRGGSDTLGFEMKNFNLAALGSFIKNKDLVPSGYLNAGCKLSSSPDGSFPGIAATISTDSLKMGNDSLGRLTIVGKLAHNAQILNVKIKDELDGKKLIHGTIGYDMTEKTVDAEMNFDEFPLHCLQVALSNAVDNLGGHLSGYVGINGPIKDLHISKSKFNIKDGTATVLYTNVPYTFNGTIALDDKGIKVNKFNIADKKGGNGTVQGSIDWANLSDPVFNIDARLRSLQLLQSPKITVGRSIWGNLAISGTAFCKGPASKLAIDAEVRSTGLSDVHVVLPEKINASANSLLTFINTIQPEVDPYEDMLKRSKEKKASHTNVSLNAKAILDPSLSFAVDMGSGGFAAGITGAGTGVVTLKAGTGKDLAILGDYTLQEGSFGINTSGLVKRIFQVKNGSSIQFRGDIPESIVDLTAVYETKTSISTLIADTSSVSNRRQVLCGITIKDKLSDPQMKFSIEIPDLEPSVKSRVESALSTEDKVQKQFLSLLLSNSFLPDEQNSIVNNSSFLYSNVSEMVANQFNNIFTRLDIPLDLGLNYQPTKSGASLFDVAISTQLFNNRVIIGGTFGNRENKSSGSGQSFFGDIDIQYKVNRTGTLRLKAFSHSADQYSNSLDNSQRNGIGITWQQEFDRFCTWCQELFMSKRKREEANIRNLEAAKQKRTVILSE